MKRSLIPLQSKDHFNGKNTNTISLILSVVKPQSYERIFNIVDLSGLKGQYDSLNTNIYIYIE